MLQTYADEAVVAAAAVAKLTRNCFLAGVVPLMAARHGATAGIATKAAFPTFVLGFVGAAGVRTAGDMYFAGDDAKRWKEGANFVGGALGTKCLLATGLAGVGLSVDASAFRSAGARPFLVGGAGAAIVGGVGLGVGAVVAVRRRGLSSSTVHDVVVASPVPRKEILVGLAQKSSEGGGPSSCLALRRRRAPEERSHVLALAPPRRLRRFHKSRFTICRTGGSRWCRNGTASTGGRTSRY